MTMITPSYLGETIEYSSLHACRSTLEDPTEYLHSQRAFNCFQEILHRKKAYAETALRHWGNSSRTDSASDPLSTAARAFRNS